MVMPRLLSEPDWLLQIPNDSEEAPWMVMPDYQTRVINLLLSILRRYRDEMRLRWYIGSELMVVLPRPGMASIEVAPDLFVAEGDDTWRESWNVDGEGEAPRFVLEVVTKASWERDTTEKVSLYERMGVEEYAIFAPERLRRTPRLSGYRRGAHGKWERWPLEAGALKSTALGGLTLEVEEGRYLRLRDPDGHRLLSDLEAERLAVQRAEAEAQRAEAEAQRATEAEQRVEIEALARHEAESRVAALEAEIARLRAQQPEH
jgi:Uma2 family endonuclease